MARIRLTLEYDTDGNTIEQEVSDWAAGRVDYQDLLAVQRDDYEAGRHTDILIRWERV